MRDYREKTVNGWLAASDKFMFFPVDVRMTSDNKGKSLSFTAGTVQIGIPLEQVRDIIVLAEKEVRT